MSHNGIDAAGGAINRVITLMCELRKRVKLKLEAMSSFYGDKKDGLFGILGIAKRPRTNITSKT